tara:strand:- start:3593 stop:4405 length:813 start_codon:yes stop_codon:yes gene_type:complete
MLQIRALLSIGKNEKPDCIYTSNNNMACCWGKTLQGKNGSHCENGFVAGNRHFNTKFCEQCAMEMIVPSTNVRALSDEHALLFYNKRSSGMWNRSPKQMGSGKYRVINNTSGCTGPRLAVFSDTPPLLDWMQLPRAWVTLCGNVRLCVSKGTLVPSKKNEQPASIELCEVLVPSGVMQFGKDPEECKLDDWFDVIDDSAPLDDMKEINECGVINESPQERRMRMNRESAAKSRKRKISHVLNLERSVVDLSQMVIRLRAENMYLNPEFNL